MSKGRLEAFTDAVIAIILTILVLELNPPHSGSLASLWALRGRFGIYLVSFLTLIVYWNNHHHLFQLVNRIDWRVMWANSFFMLAISMFPFATSWVGEGHVDAFGPELIYGFVVFMSNVSYLLLVVTLRHVNVPTSELVKLYGHQHDWKAVGSIVMAFIAMILALLWPPLTIILDLLMLLLWAIPDQRVERHLLRGPKE